MHILAFAKIVFWKHHDGSSGGSCKKMPFRLTQTSKCSFSQTRRGHTSTLTSIIQIPYSYWTIIRCAVQMTYMFFDFVGTATVDTGGTLQYRVDRFGMTHICSRGDHVFPCEHMHTKTCKHITKNTRKFIRVRLGLECMWSQMRMRVSIRIDDDGWTNFVNDQVLTIESQSAPVKVMANPRKTPAVEAT